MNGLNESWKRLYNQWYGTIIHRANSIVTCTFDAGDVAHNTLIKLHKHYETFEQLALKQQSQYINTVLKNEYIDLMRYRSQIIVYSDEMLTPLLDRKASQLSPSTLTSERTECLDAVFKMTNDQTATLIKMRYVDEMKVKDIALAVGLSENNVSVLLHRFRQKERKNISNRLQNKGK